MAAPMDTTAPSPEAETVLKTIVKNGQIPNALVFTGQKDSGRKQAAIGFAQTINCQKDDRISADGKPCHQCPSCRKTASGAHPDILSVVPENGIIRTAQIKNIFSSTSTRPHEGKRRMVVIEDADMMNREASNSLLKILEEPPLRTFFVLTAKNLTDLLPTIVSRCRHVRFKPVPAKTIQQTLVTDHGVEPVLAAVAAEYGEGSLNRAMMFASLPGREDPTDWVQRRKWIIGQISEMITGKNTDCLAMLAFTERLSKEAHLLDNSMVVIRTWLRDLAVYRFSPEQIVNRDHADGLQKICGCLPLEKGLSLIEELHGVEKKLQANTIPRLTLESFFLKFYT